MKRTVSVLSMLLLALTATMAFAGPYTSDQSRSAADKTPSAKNCQTTLGNNSYACNVKSSFGTSFTDCYEFTSPGVTSANFDMFPVGLDATLGCSCDPTGGSQNPKFNASPNAFNCTGVSGEEAFDFAGKATSTKIKGIIAGENGDSFVFSCTKQATACE